MLDLSFRPEDCMEEFVLKYENRLYRTAIAIIGNKADACFWYNENRAFRNLKNPA